MAPDSRAIHCFLRNRATSSALAGAALAGFVLAAAIIATPAQGATFVEGSLVVCTGNTLLELNQAGSQLQSVTIPYPGAGAETARDLTIDRNGGLHIYNGTFDPFLSTYDPVSGGWSHHTHAGWSTANNISYGGIAVAQSFVYVTDMWTVGDEPNGIVRFDLDDYTAERFAGGTEYIDLNIGLDGLLYALYPGGSSSGTDIDVFEPASMDLIRTIHLPVGLGMRAIAIDRHGQIFGAAWSGTVYRFDAVGIELESITSGFLANVVDNLTDIEVGSSNELVVGTRSGTVIVADTSLRAASGRALDTGSGSAAFVALVSSSANPVEGATWGQIKRTYSAR